MLAILSNTIFLRYYCSKWQLWWLAILLVLLLNPLNALNISLWLSFLSVAGLLLIPVGIRGDESAFNHYAFSF